MSENVLDKIMKSASSINVVENIDDTIKMAKEKISKTLSPPPTEETGKKTSIFDNITNFFTTPKKEKEAAKAEESEEAAKAEEAKLKEKEEAAKAEEAELKEQEEAAKAQEEAAKAEEEQEEADLDVLEKDLDKLTPSLDLKTAASLVGPYTFLFYYLKMGILVLIILFIALNIIAYAGDGNDTLSAFAQSFVGKILFGFADFIRSLIGLPPIIIKDTSSEPDDDTKNDMNAIPVKKPPKLKTELSAALDQAPERPRFGDIAPDDMNSSIQSAAKSGWCYVGTDRGHRSCMQVGDSDVCMSGNIFPSKDICINPKLRM